MKKLKDKRFVSAFFLSISVILIFIFIDYIDISGLMGNSVIKSYYYCQDNTYTLNGNVCIKKSTSNAVLIGDVDLNGEIEAIDSTLIERYLQDNSIFDDFKKKLADVNGDETVNYEDLKTIKLYLLNSDISSKINLGKDTICPIGYNRTNETYECIKEEKVKAKKVDFVLGDVNADMKVDNSDTELIQQYVSGMVEFNDNQKKVADTNLDGNVDTKDTIKTVSNTVVASITTLNNIEDITLNSKINYQAMFTVTGNKKYYYKWFDVKSSSNTVSSDCKIVSSGKLSSYSINATNNNEHILLRIYDDSTCSNMVSEYKTDYIKIKENSDISLDYKLVSHSLTSNIVNYQSELRFDGTFNVTGSKYYYKWNTYSNDKLVSSSSCTVADNKTKSFSLKINGKDQYGRWDLYTDSNCSTLLKSYSTDKYNYYASKISLNVKNYNMNVGDKYTLKPTITSNIDNALTYLKYTSSNVSVASIDNNGVITAKGTGSATIKATIGNISDYVEITVGSNNNDLSITCPEIKYKEDDTKTTFSINPNNNILKYDVYLSINDHVGTYAEYEPLKTDLTSSQTFNNLYNGTKSNQAKIVVYSKNGNSRNCYTPPLTWKWNTRSQTATCPAFNENFGYKISGISNYVIKNGDSNVYTGISKMDISFDTSSDYQYSYYEPKKGGGHSLTVTYPNIKSTRKYTLISEIYNKNVRIVVTDKKGNNITCSSNSINRLNLIKTSVGTTDIYYETTTNKSDKDEVIKQMKVINSWSPSYLAASAITVYSESSYLDIFGDGTCGFYHPQSNNISLRASNPRCGGSSTSAWYVGAIHHEFGHSIDWMNGRLTGTNLTDLEYNGKKLKYYRDKYHNQKLCNDNKNYCLRFNSANSYGNSNVELVADIFSYEKHGFYGNDEWKSVRDAMLNTYLNNYNSNKSKFNSIKESFK